MNDMEDLGFDANTVEPDAGFTPLPAGEYDVMISGSEKKATANGNGSYLKLELTVLNGEYQNRKHFENLNLWNQNAQTVQIAKSQLSAIGRATGVMTPKSSQEFVGKTLRVKLTVKPRKDEPGTFQNRVTGWLSRGTATQPPAQPALAGVGSGNGW